MYVLILFLTAATFLSTPAAATGFAQEYNIVDGVPCTKQLDESWLCIDDKVNTTVFTIPSPKGSIYVNRLSTLFGIKINCGGDNVHTWFFRPTLGDIPDHSIFQMDCTELASVSTVRANNYFEVNVYGQDLSFTDANPCTEQMVTLEALACFVQFCL
ncbi:hypothetical protein LX32DRAFT_655780 [Colletotrichum zoysiae]|uniref:Hypersensitive response-inducing protein n=1 Tax=Colletotrichum zoysiae TaxID=1216348 RepID=A0AAD9HB21_9PEZI|nr:hypothetical protein LX32DRAFT_655780 [Colletotrichum zoysiae]